jgi:chitodextrinase
MSRYDATVTVSSETEAQAVKLVLEQAYNTLREETGTVGNRSELLSRLEAVMAAAQQPRPGTLTISYEFDEDYSRVN